MDARPTVEIKLRLKIKFLWRSMDATKAKWYKITHTAVWYWKRGRRILRTRIQLLDRYSTWLLDVHWRLSSNCTGATVWRCFASFQNFEANQTTNNCTTKLNENQFDWFPSRFSQSRNKNTSRVIIWRVVTMTTPPHKQRNTDSLFMSYLSTSTCSSVKKKINKRLVNRTKLFT